ncbi:MAG: anthranilate synthase component I [Candidatus Latescibacteria bacterium]|nr:anthranilate synthase component I [Candidatus Latescibacterota bacterium]
MIRPDFEEFKQRVGEGTVIPVVQTILADTETPVSAYLKIRGRSTYSFLLESVEGGEKMARYSFLGADPFLIFRSRGKSGTIRDLNTGKECRFTGNPIDELRELMKRYKSVDFPGLPRFTGGGVGYFSYDSIRLIESIPDTTRDDYHIDDVFFMFFDTILVFDNIGHTISIISNVHTDTQGSLDEKYHEAVLRIERLDELLASSSAPPPSPGDGHYEVKPNIEKTDYLERVKRCKEYIYEGDIIQVVFSQRFEREITVAPFDIYRMLRIVNPSPYMFFIATDHGDIVGASPEMLVRVEGREIEVRPIAGTRRRGKTPEEDNKLAEELRMDEKECAEHVMLLDLGRNDVGRVARYGSVHVDGRMFIERYSHVMHMVSSVKGTLEENKDRFDALLSVFPAGTLSGAPKIRAMEIIDELEPTRRGIYGGGIGYADYQGNLDYCITIRTMLIKNGTAYIQAGGGIVADSVPENEYQETVNKAMALFRAIDMAENGELAVSGKGGR